MSQLQSVLSDLKDVETGARSFALTNDPRFLEPYVLGKANVAKHMGELRACLGQENSLSHIVDVLDNNAARRIALADQLVDLSKPRSDMPDVLTASIQGKQSMDRIKQQVASAVSTQQKVKQSRKEAFERQAVLTSAALIGGVAVCLVVLVWLFTRLNREVSLRTEVEDELRVLNSDLEERVQKRTAGVKRAGDLLNAVVENLPDMILLKEPSSDGFRYLFKQCHGLPWVRSNGLTTKQQRRKEFFRRP